MFVQSSFYWVLYYAGTMFSANRVHAIAASCHQVYPSEYAYKDDSVAEQESIIANCRRYQSGLQDGVFTEQYTHCNGTQLKLIDSNLGQGHYQISHYYVWLGGSAAQVLFIFPTRVSLTTITLHYYSGGVQGLPRLEFYAVPNVFDVWDAPTNSYPSVHVASVPPSRGSGGHKNISINVNFNTKKVLMYKYSGSNNELAVSEMEFFTCTPAISTLSTTKDPTTSAKNESSNTITESDMMENGKHRTNSFSSNTSTITSFTTAELEKETVPTNSTTRIVAIGVSIAILLILSTILIIIVVVLIWIYKRRLAKQKLCTDCAYSTLSRASGPQTRTRSTQENSSELYDQIHLSPSTGQTEYIPKSENADINNPFTTPLNSHPIYSTAGEDTVENSSTLNATSQETPSQLSSQVAHESTSEQPTYAAINKSKKKKFKAGEKGPLVSSYARHNTSAQKEKENTTKQDIHSPHTIEELYTAVKKKDKVREPKDEEEAPPIPPHTVEELYAAIQKKPKGRSNADSNKVEHIIPSRLEEQTHVAGEITLQNTAEHPYTAVTVTNRPKDGSTENTETAPPIPPHIVEELYTAVMKMPKSGAEDEDKATPKPLWTVEKN